MLYSFFIQLLLAFLVTIAQAQSDYYERLTLYPLPLGSLLASFDFRSNESVSAFEAQNFRYFPRSLGQILQHAKAKELHLRFSTGRWDPETWGARPWDGFKEGGTGVELWAWIEAGTDAEAFERWTTLTQSLSGLFCASLNFIDATKTTRPATTFEPLGDRNILEGTYLLHGVLPGEVVCTENLTPFLKLLPCKGKAGISSLLDGHKVFDAAWQSMSIDIRPKCSPTESECQIEIQQTIDVVLDIQRSKRPRDNPIPRPVPEQDLICDDTKSYHSHDTCYPKDMSGSPAWGLKEVFGRPMVGSCPLTDDDGPDAKSICLVVPHDRMVMIGGSGFEVKSRFDRIESRCYQLMPGEDFDMDVLLQTSKQPELDQELMKAERTITGHGAAYGGIRTVLTNPSLTEAVSFVYFESLPWFMRPFMHTLKAEIVGSEALSGSKVVKNMYYRPSIDRTRGTQLELGMSIPPGRSAILTYDFEKAILRYTEYPPDANRGFNVAPAVIRVLNETNADGSPRDVYIRTTSLLLPLPTPDFSMPYNVIILTSTVMALAFGSIFNLLVRRFVGVDEVPESNLAKRARYVKGRIQGLLVVMKDKIRTKARKLD
jgi:phosphatidylinositol glycan class T